jgi:hypothetical protein
MLLQNRPAPAVLNPLRELVAHQESTKEVDYARTK